MVAVAAGGRSSRRGALALSTDRRRTVVQLGIGVAVAAIVLIVALGVGRAVVVDAVDGAEARAAVGAIWDAFLGDLRTAAWILAGSGAVVAAAAASLIRPVDARAPLRAAAAWVATEPERPALRALRARRPRRGRLVCVLATRRDAVHLLRDAHRRLSDLRGRQRASCGSSTSRGRRRGEHRGASRAPARRRAAGRRRARRPAHRRRRGAFVGSGGTTTAAPAAGHLQRAPRAVRAAARPTSRCRRPTTRCRSRCRAGISSEQERPIPEQLGTASAAC